MSQSSILSFYKGTIENISLPYVFIGLSDFFTIANFNFFFINLIINKQHLGAIIVGPSLSPQLEEATYHEHEPIPTLHYQQRLAISLFVYYSIYQRKLNKTAVIHYNQELKPLIRHEGHTAL